MRKRTSTNSRNNLGIIALSLMLGFISFSPVSAFNETKYGSNQVYNTALQGTNKSTASAKTTEQNRKGKQEKVHVILNGDTIVSYAAVDSATTDLSEESSNDSVSVTNVNINGKDVKVDQDAINKIYTITDRLQNIVYTLGNSTFGSIIGVLIGLVVATLAIVFVIFILGFPVWIILFFIWLYRRIRKNRDIQREKDEASYVHRETRYQEPKQYSNKNNADRDFAQSLNNEPDDYNYREAIMAANNLIESATVQIFIGLGIGFFLYVFISSTMGIAIGGLILFIGIGKYMSGKQRLKNIKEDRADRENYYRPNNNQQAKQKDPQEENDDQKNESADCLNPQKEEEDNNRQQL